MVLNVLRKEYVRDYCPFKVICRLHLFKINGIKEDIYGSVNFSRPEFTEILLTRM